MTYTLRLPAKHAMDWLSRYDGEGAEALCVKPRSCLLSLNREALEDLISDAIYYAEEMDPSNTGDIDYRPAARRCLAAIEREGVTFSRNGFSVTVSGKDRPKVGRS